METYTTDGQQLDVRSDPIACNGERLYIGIFASDAVPRIQVWTMAMPSGWERGDPWPDMGDDGWEDQGQQSTPSMSFQKDESEDTLRVVSAGSAKWRDITIAASPSAKYSLNEGARQGIDGDGQPVTTTDREVTAGDRLLFCGSGQVEITLTYEPSGQLVGVWDFALQAC